MTKEGLLKIISLKAAMNKGISSSLQATFPDLVNSPRPLVENPKIEDPNWLSGFCWCGRVFFSRCTGICGS